MVDYTNRGVVWYAMQTTYKRELMAKAYLEARGVECFVAMQRSVCEERGRRKIALRPAIHNLIFVRVDAIELRELKISLGYLHNILTELDGRLVPIVVSAPDMEQFICASTQSPDDVTYLDIATTSLDKGTKVRVTGGEFKGCEGVLFKVKGARSKRVVIAIEGLIAVALANIDATLIEKI